MATTPTAPGDAVAGCAAAHRALEATIATLDDDAARRDTRLPGWSVGHLLTHLARNADSHVHVGQGVIAGEVRDQYPGGFERRNADIAAGAGRAADELIADVGATNRATEATWAGIDAAGWATGTARAMKGEWRASEFPFYRWREVELHHIDLDLGHELAEVAPGYIALELAWQAPALSSRLIDGQPKLLRATDLGVEAGDASGGLVEAAGWELIGWLFGRGELAGAPELKPWP